MMERVDIIPDLIPEENIFDTFDACLNWIKEHIAEVEQFTTDSKEAVEAFRIKYLGKKGLLNDFFSEFKNVANDQKKEFGQTINTLKQVATEKVNSLKDSLESNSESTNVYNDLTRPGEPVELGARHPISIIYLLRTHTSSVQVRYMENNKPPIRTISPGRVYRNEAISARSHCFFHQLEGLYIDKDVSFADLKQTLQFFTTELFGKSKIRFRPSYFPFTEPSAEVDVYWGLETEADYRITKGTGWLEIGWLRYGRPKCSQQLWYRF
ncbi:Phenylalanine--tRNA ligase alpha subunit [Nymphon striatum]|nr:Phenylalanine--tRNA ligase alpha subunit [Nymphon striatum]